MTSRLIEGMPALDARPAAVSRATALLYGSLGVGLVRSAMEFPRLSSASSAGFVIRVQVVVFAFMWLLIFLIGRRRNWARIAFVVLFLLGVPLSVKPLLDSLSAEPVSGVLGLAQVAMQIAALVLLFSPGARGWFRRPLMASSPVVSQDPR